MNIKIFYFTVLLMSLLVSCNESADKGNSKEVNNTSASEIYTLTPFQSSPEFPDARIEKMSYDDGQFDFSISGDSYTLGNQTSDAETKMCANSAKGQHIHLIVDNGPYAAKYVSTFDHEVADGEHYLLAFLSRSYHESIKTEAAHTAQKINVSSNSIIGSSKVEDAMLFYSRPKGTYVGKDTEKVMLDFYLSNTSISENGNKVIADINGEKHTLTSWQPYYVEGLPMGENKIELSLVDKDGALVDAPLNPVTRTFTLKADPSPTN